MLVSARQKAPLAPLSLEALGAQSSMLSVHCNNMQGMNRELTSLSGKHPSRPLYFIRSLPSPRAPSCPFKAVFWVRGQIQ